MALLQQPFHAVAKCRLGDLTRVGWAHRRDVIGVVQPRLQERDLPVKLQTVHVKERPWQIDVIHVMGVVHPLIGQVMHGKDRFRRVAARGEIRRGKPGVPVVRVYHIRPPERIQPRRHFCSNPAEERKAQHVIGVREQVRIVIRATRAIV